MILSLRPFQNENKNYLVKGMIKISIINIGDFMSLNPEEAVENPEKIAEETPRISIQLGDVINIEAPANEYLDKNTFIVNYLDDSKMLLIDATTLKPIKIKINEDHTLGDGTITSISLLYRNDVTGYARQNGLLPGVWLNIYFGGEIPTIITGEITNLEEDMIEITTYPEKEIIYINFAYKGIPEDLPIELFEIRKKPEIVEEAPTGEVLKGEAPKGEALVADTVNSDSTTSDEPLKTERQDVSEDEDQAEYLEPTVNVKNTIREFIIRADEIQFGKQLDSIYQYVDVDVSRQRYNIETQTSDLLDELLSSIPNIKRTTSVLNNIHTTIERFKQLREDFSIFDERGVISSALLKDSSWKPLVKELKTFNTVLHWLLPVAHNVKKVYDISTKEDVDYQDINPLNIMEETSIMENVMNRYRFNETPGDQNKYITMMNELYPQLVPFREINPESSHETIIGFMVKNDINVIIDNLGDFYSSIVENDIVKTKRFVIQKYNLGLKRLQATQLTGSKMISQQVQLTPPDTLLLKSVFTMPEPVARFSRIHLPGTNIMEKTNLNNIFINYWQILNKKTSVTNVIVDEFKDELEFNEESFLEGMKNYLLVKTDKMKEMSESEIYEQFLDKIIPKTRVLFNMIKKYIRGKLSFFDVISMLEPFLVYTTDITYMQYKEINEFVQLKISEYNKKFIERRKHFAMLARGDDGRLYKNRYDDPTISSQANPDSLTAIFSEKKEDLFQSYEVRGGTSSELLKEIISVDKGNLFNSIVSLENLDLMLPESVNSIIDNEIDVLNKTTGDKDTCNTYIIVKQYDSIDELSADNDKKLYVDKKFDKTPYNILDEYQKEQIKMNADDFFDFLTNKLMVKYTYSENEAPVIAAALITGLKEVQEGEYAIVYMPLPEDKIKYYVRVNDRWVEDENIDSAVSSNSQSMLCNFQKNCIEVDKKYQTAVCESQDASRRSLTKNALGEMVEEFDKTYIKSKEALEAELGKTVDYYSSIMENLKMINNNRKFKYNAQQFTIGIKNEKADKEIDIPVSPFSKLFGVIMGQSDFIKKQTDLLQFSTRFTREAISTENPHWRYCIQTSVKLLPTFLYTLAGCFANNQDNYSAKVDTIIKEIGKLSDDGDAWVDEHSGFIIRKIDFDIDEGYEEGYKIKSREVMEQDAGDALLNGAIKTPAKFETPETKMINNIINALSGFMGLNIEQQREFIVKIVVNSMPLAVPSEAAYKERVASMAKKGKTIPTHKIIYNLSVLFLTMGAFLIGIQTSMPSLKTRKTFPGCVRSFSGFPLEGAGDLSGLQYIACVAYHIRSKKKDDDTNPWSVIATSKEPQISEKLKGFIETYFLNNADVVRKFQEKVDYLLLQPEDEYIPVEHNLSKWGSFLPPLVPYHIKNGLESISPEFKKMILQDFKNASRKQREKILVIESKIILFSLSLQEKIQNIVAKKSLVLTNSANDPFLENACCNEDNSESILSYFNKTNNEIGLYNEIVKNLTTIIDDIHAIIKSPFLFCSENTKNIYPPVSDDFNEETIYRAFIKMCKFKTNIPLDEELLAICSDKPDFLIGNESINEIIRKLKQDGRNYDNKSFLRLLQVTNRQNMITHRAQGNDSIVTTSIQRIRDVLEVLSKDSVISSNLRDKLELIIDTYDLTVKEDTDEMRDLKNYLGGQNEKMKKNVAEFISQNGNISKRDVKNIETVINSLLSWKSVAYGISDDVMYNSIQFVKTYIDNLLLVFPHIILNKVDYKAVQIPQHWGLSDRHEGNVKNIISGYYNKLRAFYDDEQLVPLLNYVNIKCQNMILLMKETPYFTDIKKREAGETGDTIVSSIFDKRTSALLFEHYFLLVLQNYIMLTEDDDMLVSKKLTDSEDDMLDTVEDLEDEEQVLMPSLDPTILLGNKKELRGKVSKLLIAYLSIIEEHKNIVDTNYDTVMDKVFKSKEKEKDTFTDRLKSLTDEERQTDTVLKINKLGVWSKGLRKGLTSYVKETYDEEREEMEKLAELERKVRKNRDVNDENIEQYVDDYLDEEERGREIDEEEYDMGGMTEDYMDGFSRFGEERDAEEDEMYD